MAGLEIIIPTHFNNPALPTTPVYGFRDDFNRADSGSLGYPNEGTAWQLLPASGSAITALISGGKLTHTAGTAYTFAVVESNLANGKLAATYSVANGNDIRLAFRVVDSSNCYYLSYSVSGGTVALSKLVAGAATALGTAVMSAGEFTQEVSVVFNGSTIEAYAGTRLLRTWAGETAHQTATKHGPMLHNSNTIDRLDAISVTKL